MPKLLCHRRPQRRRWTIRVFRSGSAPGSWCWLWDQRKL